MDEISGVEVRLSFPFGSLAERRRESEFPQLTPEASPLSLLFALPILELLGRASVVDDDVGEGDVVVIAVVVVDDNNDHVGDDVYDDGLLAYSHHSMTMLVLMLILGLM